MTANRTDLRFQVFRDFHLVVEVQTFLFGHVAKVDFVDDERSNGFEWQGCQFKIFAFDFQQGNVPESLSTKVSGIEVLHSLFDSLTVC